MNIIAIDDEELALEQIMEVLENIFPKKEAKIKGFKQYREALNYLEELGVEGSTLEYAFLDIKMRGMRGIELAKKIKEQYKNVKILFVTGYSEFAYEAFQLHALGYLLKPITKEAVEEVLDSLNHGWRENVTRIKEIKIQTFGTFDIYVKDNPISFRRSKAKELLAYLVDRKGSGSTTAQISAILWEDKEYTRSLKNQTQKIISSMMESLREVGMEEIIIKKWNYLAIDIKKVECDYYNFLREDIWAINSYMGEYMVNYSWAEFTTANLHSLSKRL